MTIVKKLGVVLITTVGISFGVVGTTLADMVIKVDKILVPEDEELIFEPSNMAANTICFQTTDKLNGYIFITAGMNKPEFKRATPKETCISTSSNRMPILITGAFRPLPDESKSIRVYVKELQ
ncbi:hypothetical protein [Microcoleus sp. B9-D4]|uniref:hypothetical protein n=1 Tax=Microcoleus sp. B9-D4 TaxID=2818711 RepID=UPI002FD5AAEC